MGQAKDLEHSFKWQYLIRVFVSVLHMLLINHHITLLRLEDFPAPKLLHEGTGVFLYFRPNLYLTKPIMNPIWAIVAIILGVTLYKQFDFQTYSFENTPLAIIYLVTFLAAVYFLIKGRKQSVK